MHPVNLCYSKVKKDCIKFISSQETRTEKFRKKDKMIKSFLIPACFWLANRVNKKNTMIIGLAGGQGTGKTTISSLIKIIFDLEFDLRINFLLMTRGVPGTHDVDLILSFFRKVSKKRFSPVLLPKFDKSIDDRLKRDKWYKIKKKPNIVILEGWCVGSSPQKLNNLKKPINTIERDNDQKLKWRKYVNNQLNKKYKSMYKFFDYFLYLKAKNFSLLRKWRLKQEKKLYLNNKSRKNSKIMNNKEVLNFMMTYQRITEHMFKEAPKFASIVFSLNQNHEIKNIKYKK